MKTGGPPVLLIEDSEVVGYLLQQVLERNGVETRWLRDGRIALAAIERELPPRVVLMDLALPYADGFELLRRLRANPQWADVPVFVVTAKAKPTDRARAIACGATEYFVKPLDPDELLEKVRGCLNDPATAT